MEVFTPTTTNHERHNFLVYRMDKLTQNNVLLGFSIICFISLIYVDDEIHEIALISISVVLYYTVELSVTSVIKDVLLTGKYFQKSLKNILIYIPIGIFGAAYLKNILSSIETTKFIQYYYKAVIITLSILNVSIVVRSLFTGIGIFSQKVIRMGGFGIIQRLFLFFRCIAVMPNWLDFLMQRKYWKRFGIFLYVLIKLILLFYILTDTIDSIQKFVANRTRMPNDYVPNDESKKKRLKNSKLKCDICRKCPEEPKVLHCGRIACYGCAYHWLTRKRRCLVCPQTIAPPLRIDLADGYVQPTLLLSAF